MKTGVEDWMIWSEIGSGFGELGSKPQRRIPQGLAPPQGGGGGGGGGKCNTSRRM